LFNLLILYAFLMSFWLRLYHHGRVIVPGKEGAGLTGFARFRPRVWIIGLVFITGIREGIPGEGYITWWMTYALEHSMTLWFLTTLLLTAALWIVKEITYQVMTKPGVYQWFEKDPPQLHKISMMIPTVWNIVFWAWLLLSPSLPFYSCFFRIFLGGTSTAALLLFEYWGR